MSLPKILIACSLVFTLGACGFRPLYGTTGDRDVADTLSQIEIAPIPDRLGQQIHNGLLSALAPRGPQGTPRFALKVTVTEGISSLAVKKSAFATRADLQLRSDFQLTELQTGRGLFSSNSLATSSFNILNSEFATLMAENSARNRAIKQMVDDIRTKLAVFLKN